MPCCVLGECKNWRGCTQLERHTNEKNWSRQMESAFVSSYSRISLSKLLTVWSECGIRVGHLAAEFWGDPRSNYRALNLIWNDALLQLSIIRHTCYLLIDDATSKSVRYSCITKDHLVKSNLAVQQSFPFQFGGSFRSGVWLEGLHTHPKGFHPKFPWRVAWKCSHCAQFCFVIESVSSKRDS